VGTPQTPAGGLRPPAPPAQEFPNYIVLFCTYYMSRSSGGFVTEYNTVVYSCVSRLGVAGARWIFVWRPQGSSLLYTQNGHQEYIVVAIPCGRHARRKNRTHTQP